VRDELWGKAVKALKAKGSVMQVWSSSLNPQGFDFRQHGPCSREFVEFEGLYLVSKPEAGCEPPHNSDTMP